METIRYEIEATADGYTEKLYVDGKMVCEFVAEKTNGGTKGKSGTPLDVFCENDNELQEISDKLPTFFGFELNRFMRNF